MVNTSVQWTSSARRVTHLVGFGKKKMFQILLKFFFMLKMTFKFQILGYDSLEIIPFLAIIILSFRKESLMQVNTIENIEAVLADLSSLKILPLIQLTLSLKS